MDRDSYEKAKDERAQLFQERARIDRRLKLLDEFIQLHERLFVESDVVETHANTHEVRGTTRRRRRGAISTASIGDYAREFIRKAERPLTRGELLRIFEEHEVPIVGGDRAKVLGTTLWRLKRDDGEPAFVSTGSGYWPSDLPLPEA